MTAILYPLAKPSDYIRLEDGSYTLPETDEYLLLDGAYCDNPETGAPRYNLALVRHLKRVKAKNFGEPRYHRIFQQYAHNRRVKKVVAVLRAVKDQDVAKQAQLHAESKVESTLSRLESVLFCYIPVEHLQSE